MHWGVRRFQPYSQTGGRKSGKAGKEIGKAARAERKAARKAKIKSRASIARNYTGSKRSDAVVTARHHDINQMSNQELQQHITRMNLERQYRSLTAVDLRSGSNYMKLSNEYDTKMTRIAKRAIQIKSGDWLGVKPIK